VFVPLLLLLLVLFVIVGIFLSANLAWEDARLGGPFRVLLAVAPGAFTLWGRRGLVVRKLRTLLLIALAGLALYNHHDRAAEWALRAYAWYTTEDPLTPPAKVLVDRLADAGRWEGTGRVEAQVVTLQSRGGGQNAISVDVQGGGLKVLQGAEDVTALLTGHDRKRVRAAALACCEAVLTRDRERLAGRLDARLRGTEAVACRPAPTP
jgi:hypothetical protein